MALSLKSTLPALGRILGMTPSALYERQKLLVLEGLLHAVPGRGPGSGVPATPESLATLLIGTFAGFGLEETGSTARAISEASAETTCPLTGEKSFRSALALLLAEQSLADRTSGLEVVTSLAYATIYFRDEPWTGIIPPPPAPQPPQAKESKFRGKVTKVGAIHFNLGMAGPDFGKLAVTTRILLEDQQS